ncbi:FAD-dependent oxidoreductase [Rhodococcus sp. NPDC056960]|uniref:FAD-dependent oxidoreductase n=1 Tax=Rhodococcus TaxID=1827 RepID=UPI0036288290
MNYDVIVVGAGGAGLAAAVEASAHGASVLVLEAADQIGGSTIMSRGVVYATGTSVQRAVGVEDSVERMYRYYMALNSWELEPSVAWRFCEESGPTLEWLRELGADYSERLLYVSDLDNTRRGHECAGGGPELVAALEKRAREQGVIVKLSSRVRELLIVDGAVRGVRIDDEEFRAGAVVLATGGIGANPDLVAKYFPAARAHGPDWTNYFGSPTSRGDAITMTRQLDAEVFGRGFGMLNLTAGFSKSPSSFVPAWIVFVNLDGRRFMAETSQYAVAGSLIEAQRESRCFAVFDEAARAASVAPHLSVGEYTWGADTIMQMYNEGRVLRSDTLTGLAEQAGVAPVALDNNIAEYNADVRNGGDRRYRKTGQLRELSTKPFYAVELRPSAFGITFCGVRIDEDARVRSNTGTVIPGLYAAGEAAGGIMGPRYVGGGNAISAAIIFGRIAGRTARDFSQSAKPRSTDDGGRVSVP